MRKWSCIFDSWSLNHLVNGFKGYSKQNLALRIDNGSLIWAVRSLASSEKI